MTDLLNSDTHVSARRAQTREKLMNAAVSVFAARGIIGASVEEICETAGFTRGAFYSNFAGKDQLVLELIRHATAVQYAAAERAVEAVKAGVATMPAEEVIAAALRAFTDAGAQGREWILTERELLLYAARQPEVREQYLLFDAESKKQFSILIHDAVAAAEHEFTIPFDAAITLMVAAHSQSQIQALFDDAVDSEPFRLLLLSITRAIPRD